MVDFFIRRPIFATVCALLIVLAGAVVIPTLPISLYPQLAPPQVVVTSNYIGANSQIVESAVTIPSRPSINGVEGMRYMSSTSSNDGTSAITITFQTGYDLNIAAVDVQNRVASAQGRLPATCQHHRHHHHQGEQQLRLRRGLLSPDARYSQAFISNYLDVYVKDALKRVPGVGDVIIFGERKYAMRIWLDPARLAARGLTALDVTNALSEQNVEVAAGQLGRQPSDPKPDLPDGSPRRRPSDRPARVRKHHPQEFADQWWAWFCSETSATPRSALKTTTPDLKFSGGDAVGLGVQQLSNANALEVDRQCRAVLAELAKSFPPGLSASLPSIPQPSSAIRSTKSFTRSLKRSSSSSSLSSSSLQDWRATIIPAVTIPVSLIGTFAFIKIFGFSINSLTLFGITLATGLVVDDAIVVIENVQRHIA